MSINHIDTNHDFLTDFTIREEAFRMMEDLVTKAPIDLRDALKSYNPQADEYQLKVINSTSETIRVVAPAGSGKTQTLINRVIQSIKKGLNPSRILILTFDNSAADSLRLKLHEQTTQLKINISNLRITTLNAYGFEILRLYVPTEYKQIISRYRQRSLFKDVLSELSAKSKKHFSLLPNNIKERFYLEYFSLLKNELFDPRNPGPQKLADFLLKSPVAVPFFQLSIKNQDNIKLIIQAIIWLYQTYEEGMRKLNLMDFDDQKLRPYIHLQNALDLKQTLQTNFSEILVDEFQDINTLDFAFIKLLSEQTSLLVTGDDDQAIYGFRGCTPDYIIELDKYLNRETDSYELQVNYRSPENLLQYANHLIVNNKKRIPKNPIAFNKGSSNVKVISTLSAGLESKLVISFIKKAIQKNPNLNYSDFAILYRTNAQSLPFQIEFILNDIPFFVREQDNILTNETLEKLLGVLRLQIALQNRQIPNPQDCLLTLKAYFRFINNQESAKLDLFFKNNTNFRTAIISNEIYSILPKIKVSSISKAVEDLLLANTLLKTLDVISLKFKGLYGMLGSLEDVINEQVPLGEIYEIALNFKGNTKDFVHTLDTAISKAKQTNAGNRKEDGAALLTYFKSKGLQWHTVILSSCNDGLIPHKRADIEDERRLFYVALTRATSNLLLTYVKKSCNNIVSPSRFLYEAKLLTV